jgi:hypothetical protein
VVEVVDGGWLPKLNADFGLSLDAFVEAKCDIVESAPEGVVPKSNVVDALGADSLTSTALAPKAEVAEAPPKEKAAVVGVLVAVVAVPNEKASGATGVLATVEAAPKEKVPAGATTGVLATEEGAPKENAPVLAGVFSAVVAAPNEKALVAAGGAPKLNVPGKGAAALGAVDIAPKLNAPGATAAGVFSVLPGVSVPQAAHLTSSTLFLAKQISQFHPGAILNPEEAHKFVAGGGAAGFAA